jgi:hypothetical protein
MEEHIAKSQKAPTHAFCTLRVILKGRMWGSRDGKAYRDFLTCMFVATLRVDPEGAGPPARNLLSDCLSGLMWFAVEGTGGRSANEELWHAHRQGHNGGNDAGCACFSPSRS